MSLEDIQQAITLLQSLGVENLCHNDLDYLPNCTEKYSYLRGSSIISHHRQLEPRTEFATLEEEEIYFLYNIAGALGCVAAVALIAGLFLGLLTLDILQLRIILRSSNDDDERLYANTLLPIVEQRHLLLVTLLLMNALAYETLPIFLDSLVPSWVAILLSTTLVMFFGEILPSGIFMGPQQLYLGYKLSGLTKFCMWVLYPFAKPLALCLDFLVNDDSEEGGDYNREELSALVRIQYEDSQPSSNKDKQTSARIMSRRVNPVPPCPKPREDTWYATKQEIFEKANTDDDDDYDSAQQLAPPLHPSEVDLIEGALQMKISLVMDVYTPLRQVYAIPEDLVLDRKGFTKLYRMGYSRVPVYRKNPDDPDDKTAILGFLMVRQLMLIDWGHAREVSTLREALQQPQCISPRMNLVDALRILRSKGYLMTFVCARPDLANKALAAEKTIPVEAGFMGVVTLEDVMESLLQERIYDEWDTRDRDRAVATLQRWAATKLQDFVRKTKKRRVSFEKLQGETAPLIAAAAASMDPSMGNGHGNYSSF